MKKIGKYNIRIVKIGEMYGRKDCLQNKYDQPIIEFYDSTVKSQDWPDRGIFVSSYLKNTLLESTYPNGLCLEGSNPESWTVSEKDMIEVLTFVKEQA